MSSVNYTLIEHIMSPIGTICTLPELI
uniref:Uncharacterized protein n=1 Tax=Anguilla anguilla TaxID=7936 RepID=A0A0E9RWC6_ANGAN